MPKYVYDCPKCGQFEVEQRINDEPLDDHPGCGHPVQRLIPQTSFSLKGAGWYSDGYVTATTSDKGSSDA